MEHASARSAVRKPNLFMVGAPKCGTSAMYHYLRQHPHIFMSPLKEPLYFGRDHHRINHRPRSERPYTEFFAAASDQPWVGEASTSYLHSKSAARELVEFSPDSRIVIMLRNPVDVMYAYHSTTLQGGFEFIQDFKEALDAEPERKQGRLLPRIRPGILENLLYREVATFSDQVQRYLDTFGPDRVHIVIHEDLSRDPAAVYRDLLNFLGVPPYDDLTFEKVNVNIAVRNVGFNNFLWNPPAWLQRAVHAAMPRSTREAIGSKLKRFNSRKAPRPPMDPVLRRKLQAECAPDIERLSLIVGRDLRHWCSPRT